MRIGTKIRLMPIHAQSSTWLPSDMEFAGSDMKPFFEAHCGRRPPAERCDCASCCLDACV